MALAIKMYAAYAAHTDYKSAVSGFPIPRTLAGCPAPVQDAWRAAASAAITDLLGEQCEVKE